MMMVKTCSGCGSTRLTDVRDEGDLVIRREGNRVKMPKPLPLLCLDCGSTASHFERTNR